MLFPFVALLQLQSSNPADSARLNQGHATPPPVVQAVRTERAPAIDGRLDEPEWQQAPLITGFLQNNPNEGEPAVHQTEVRILYDNDALYIGARMIEPDPSAIRAQLTRRDVFSTSDYFAVEIDSYHDHQTALQFSVNPVGVRQDAIASEDRPWGDTSWDPVWQAASARDSLGWTVELRIPLSQLRFPPREDQLWGVNFKRYAAAREETSAFVLVRQNEQGNASRFAHLLGITGVPAPRRVEVMPYARTSLDVREAVPGDPFFDGSRLTGGFGVDLKYGVTSNLTLDATVNPDFGQVELDPAVLNLSVFEIFQSERRPFFVEGSQIFQFGSCNNWCFGSYPRFFYSRRVGRAPSLFPDFGPLFERGELIRGPFFDQPQNTTILGAGKITGKTAAGTSVGVLHAMTGEARASVQGRVLDPDEGEVIIRYSDVVEPSAHHSVVRLRQDLRGGATTIGVMGANVIRDLDTERLQQRFNSGATSGGFDWRHRWNQNRFDFSGYVGMSRIRGDSLAIVRAQLSSARYFQRPDRFRLDSSRTSLSGYSAAASINYNAPSGFSGGFSGTYVSPGLETNDMGFMGSADQKSGGIFGGWQRPKPGKTIRAQSVDFYHARGWTSDGTPLSRSYGAGTHAVLQNNWGASVFAGWSHRGMSRTATRGGPLMIQPQSRGINASMWSDSRKPVNFNLFGFVGDDEAGGSQLSLGGSVQVRPATHIQVSLSPNLFIAERDAFFAGRVSDPTMVETYGVRYIFAETREASLSVTTRVNYTFTPALSLQLYLRPFAAAGDYREFKELERASSYDFRRYQLGRDIFDETQLADSVGRAPESFCPNVGDCYRIIPGDPATDPGFVIQNPNVAFRALQGTAVLRWEYRPGATVFAVWTQSRNAFDRSGEFGGTRDLWDLFSRNSANVFLVKASYWFSR